MITGLSNENRDILEWSTKSVPNICKRVQLAFLVSILILTDWILLNKIMLNSTSGVNQSRGLVDRVPAKRLESCEFEPRPGQIKVFKRNGWLTRC